jgi:signal transduction histidine kinase
MYFERVSAVLRSLRFRLMLWNVAAGVLTGMGILLAVREGVRYTLVADLDQVLRADMAEIQLYFEAPGGDDLEAPGDDDWRVLQEEMERKASGHEYQGWFVQFYDRQGRPTWASRNAPALPAPTAQQQAARTFRSGDARVRYDRLPRGLDRAAAASVGCSEQFIARDMQRIDRLVMIVGGVMVLVAPIGGYLLAGRTTRILANLIHTTDRLRPSELKERLPIRGTGDELDALARTVNGLLDRLADYLRQKHDFLANAAHELRTPLAAIRSSVEVAASGQRSEAEYRELLDVVIEQCMALESLVNQLLLLSESDADRLITSSETVPLDGVVQRAVEMFQGVAEDQGLELICHPLPATIVAGNRQHLRQVLNNLLDNAVKFTAAKFTESNNSHSSSSPPASLDRGRIEVRLARDEAAQAARLTVADNGVGIPAEAQPHLFQRFFRVDRSRSREGGMGGTGLGLSICRAIVQAHRGSIEVASNVGEGTTVTVVLPLAKVDDSPGNRQLPRSRQGELVR